MTFVTECDTQGTSIVIPPTDGQISETVLVVFEDRIMNIIKRLYEPELVATMVECVRIPVYRITVDGRSICVYQTQIGAPATAIFMERAIAFGARRFLFFGSCGGIGKDVGSGELIVPTEAYRGEGTGCYYTPYDSYIKIEGTDYIVPLMEKSGLKFRKGRVWTTDAMFRETREAIDRRTAEGCIAVEMECSMIASLAKNRGIMAASLLFTDDVVGESEWYTFSDSKVLNDDTMSKIVGIAFGIDAIE